MNSLNYPCFVLRYVPPFLWGKSGHIQTFIFGAIGRFLTPEQVGERHSIILPDGSTVYYDIFEPETVKCDNVIILMCPSIKMFSNGLRYKQL